MSQSTDYLFETLQGLQRESSTFLPACFLGGEKGRFCQSQEDFENIFNFVAFNLVLCYVREVLASCDYLKFIVPLYPLLCLGAQ